MRVAGQEGVGRRKRRTSGGGVSRHARIALSIGCPSGIGPEVSLLAALEAPASSRIVLVGDHGVIASAAKARGIDARIVRLESASEGYAFRSVPRFQKKEREVLVWQPTASLRTSEARPGKPTKTGGAAQLAWVDEACDLAARGEADAMVTGPVSKEVIASSGGRTARAFLGHTEHLARRLRAPEVVMAFASKELTTALVTTHLRLGAVPRAITPESVATAAYWLGVLITDLAAVDEEGRRVARVSKRPLYLAVASLNPHAGEGGLLGNEETVSIAPGMALARRRLKREARQVLLEGPVPAESAYRLGAAGRFAAVLAMYHDQATIPMKLLGFGEAVNISLGLPIIRTSVDHGTAYDIAGKRKADPRGMREAIALATRLSLARLSQRKRSK
ncbi:4-hydroxythreonine-4-phosphate dehydrogenase PdxA [Pendulispora brunnea]|uniref:4-hydroxythreonine-4-phosphate dehydrogenase PdxA n=1 Tax=Pendulispora brunnea TaxID=2905690 RepID=A0ABZ2KFB8_9BACT